MFMVRVRPCVGTYPAMLTSCPLLVPNWPAGRRIDLSLSFVLTLHTFIICTSIAILVRSERI